MSNIPSQIYDIIINNIFFCLVFCLALAQYAKKNGLHQKRRMLAIMGVSVAVMFLFVVSIVYWLVMRKKKDSLIYHACMNAGSDTKFK
ncbi:hypothetical protein ACB092_05G256400 [Castanea dentata]